MRTMRSLPIAVLRRSRIRREDTAAKLATAIPDTANAAALFAFTRDWTLCLSLMKIAKTDGPRIP